MVQGLILLLWTVSVGCEAIFLFFSWQAKRLCCCCCFFWGGVACFHHFNKLNLEFPQRARCRSVWMLVSTGRGQLVHRFQCFSKACNEQFGSKSSFFFFFLFPCCHYSRSVSFIPSCGHVKQDALWNKPQFCTSGPRPLLSSGPPVMRLPALRAPLPL